MYAVTIINGSGDVRCWIRGTKRDCERAALALPANGWRLFSIVWVE